MLKKILLSSVLASSLLACGSYQRIFSNNNYNFILDVKESPKNLRSVMRTNELGEYLNSDISVINNILNENKYEEISKLNQDLNQVKSFEKYVNLLRELNSDKTEKYNLPVLIDSFKNENDKYFKIRYAYQVIINYHKNKKYKEEIKFIQSLNSLRDIKTVMWEQIDGFEAGAYQNLGDNVMSSYKFAMIYKNNQSNAYEGIIDFKIKSDDEWNQLLSMAKDQEDQVIFRILRGLSKKSNGDPLKELEEIASYKYNNPETTDLLTLEVARIAQLLYFNKDESSIIYINKFLDLLSKKDNKSTIDNNMFSFFNTLINDEISTSKDVLQNTIVDYLNYFENIKSIDENQIAKKFTWMKENTSKTVYNSFKYFAFEKLSKLYPENSLKQIMLSTISEYYGKNYNTNKLIETQNLNLLLEFHSIVNNNERNIFENALLEHYFTDLSKLNNLIGTLYASKGNTEKSIEFLSNSQIINEKSSVYNPFVSTIRIDNKNKAIKKVYTQLNFFKRINKIENSNPKTVIDLVKLGNAYYNMSFFGNYSMSAMTYKSVSGIYKYQIEDEKEKISKSKKFYLDALKLIPENDIERDIKLQLLKISFAEEILNSDKFEDGMVMMYSFLDERKSKSKYWSKENILSFFKSNNQLANSIIEYQYNFEDEKIKQCATFNLFK